LHSPFSFLCFLLLSLASLLHPLSLFRYISFSLP
jgi:hypothetical protein